MILFNITVIIEEEIEAEWLKWIKNVFVPDALSSNLLVSNRLLKVLNSPNEGITYCLQFIADDLKNYTEFANKHSSALLNTHTEQFKNKAVSFSSIMEFIN